MYVVVLCQCKLRCEKDGKVSKQHEFLIYLHYQYIMVKDIRTVLLYNIYVQYRTQPE